VYQVGINKGIKKLVSADGICKSIWSFD